MTGTHRRRRTSVLVLVLIGLVYLAGQWVREGRVRLGDVVLWQRDGAAAAADATGADRAFAARRSNVIVEVSGRVDRVLADDNDGSRHQRFIVELDSGLTVLVAHNIDLAERVPLARGDLVALRGEYEWTDRGGVVHWTHRDPRGRHADGWIRLAGRQYD